MLNSVLSQFSYIYVIIYYLVLRDFNLPNQASSKSHVVSSAFAEIVEKFSLFHRDNAS